MKSTQRSSTPWPRRLLMLGATSMLMLQGCTTYVQQPARPPRVVDQAPPAAQVVYTAASQQVVSVYVEPPITQPAPIAVQWAPPPLLVEAPPPSPFEGAVWVGGYWHWEGTWVWARGRWLAPPQPSYTWVQPYYEKRGGTVIFITGHWSPPGVAFVPPPATLRISLAVVFAGAVPGSAPIGPSGVFIPPPPGSRPGLIVPAPVGTPPAVVTSAPPVVNVGMRVTTNNLSNSNIGVNNNVFNTTTTNNTANISQVTNVTIVAPATATASGQPVSASVPAPAHLAAALPPVVRVYAPEPVSSRSIPSAAANRAAITLPQGQAVRPSPDPAPQRAAVGAPTGIEHPLISPSVSAPSMPAFQPPRRVGYSEMPPPVHQTLGPYLEHRLSQPARADAKTGSIDRKEQGHAVAAQDPQKHRPDVRQQQRGVHEAARDALQERNVTYGAAPHAVQPADEHRPKKREVEREGQESGRCCLPRSW